MPASGRFPGPIRNVTQSGLRYCGLDAATAPVPEGLVFAAIRQSSKRKELPGSISSRPPLAVITAPMSEGTLFIALPRNRSTATYWLHCSTVTTANPFSSAFASRSGPLTVSLLPKWGRRKSPAAKSVLPCSASAKVLISACDAVCPNGAGRGHHQPLTNRHISPSQRKTCGAPTAKRNRMIGAGQSITASGFARHATSLAGKRSSVCPAHSRHPQRLHSANRRRS